MKKTIKLMVCMLIISAVTAVTVFADYYVNVFGVNKWSRVNMQKFIVYNGSRAIAMVELWDYVVMPTSNIRFLNDFVSNGDKMLVDDKAVEIRKITKLY